MSMRYVQGSRFKVQRSKLIVALQHIKDGFNRGYHVMICIGF